MKTTILWIGFFCLAFAVTFPAHAKPFKVCAKAFQKTIQECNDKDGDALEKCAVAKYKALYECLDEKAEYKDDDRGEKKFKRVYGGFIKRANAAIAICHRYTDDEKDDCLNDTYKASLRDLNKTAKKFFAKKKGRDSSTDVDKEVGDCEGALKKKAMDCNEKEGDKFYKCIRKQYDVFYKCVVKDVKFKDGKKDAKKFEKDYEGFFGRVEDAVKICQRYTRKKMEKCLKATHKAAVKDFQNDLTKLVED